ncbi:glutathione S-transferase family protein [Neisseria brasiliensis]|uniref:glutathione S-transferase family protein n=1 Tax=Neisseria TaxID=482 RepID=UPI000C278F52|nr:MULTISPECIES: glutathione binding-like protein [Neisseria]PJO77995.1 glutathione S-transferase [Neisseria sp. N177_16]QGL26118.1 glutathione S-transferase family protein [Neisseria brasiliensis]
MLKLYYMQGACPLVPHVALEWAKADFEAVKMARDELKTPGFLALNSLGSVPVLQDGDWSLTQNMAILDFINTQYPEAKLFGKGDVHQQAKARQWLAFANADLHSTFAYVFNPNRFIEGEGEGAQIRARAMLQVSDYFGLVNEALHNQDYLTGELTIADVYVYVVLRWAKAFNIDLSHLDKLEGFYQRVEADEGVQKALKTQGLL